MMQNEAIELAREVAEAQAWPWLEPTRAIRFRRWWIGSHTWEVVSNVDKRGLNVRIVIDDSTGRIIKKRFLSR